MVLRRCRGDACGLFVFLKRCYWGCMYVGVVCWGCMYVGVLETLLWLYNIKR